MKCKMLVLLTVFLFCCTVLHAGEPTKYAVLIGVDDYPRMMKLRYAKSDIEALRDELYKIGFAKENVYCLTCGGETKNLPTKDNIEVVVESVLGMAKEGDIVVVAMNGHGIEVSGQARFCPLDTKESNLLTTTIPIDDIFAAFEHSKATFKLMLVDACRENPFTSRSVAGASTLQTLADPPKGVMLLQSCAKGELSYEDPTLKRGIFTYYFVEGLQGKAADKEGKVTLLGLASYTIEKTQRRALDEFRAKQRPYLRGEVTDYVLAAFTEVIFPDEVPNLQVAIDKCPERGTVKIRPGKYPIPATLNFTRTVNIVGMCNDPNDCILELNDLQKGVHIFSGEPKFQNISFHAPLPDDLPEKTEKALQEVNYDLERVSSSIKREYEIWKNRTTVLVEETVAQFDNCDFSGSRNGLIVRIKGNVRCLKCDFHDCENLAITETGSGHFEQCNFFKNGAPRITKAGKGYFEQCKFFQNTTGLNASEEGVVQIKECRFFDNDYNGIHLCDGSHGTIENSAVFRNGLGHEGAPQVAICSSNDIRLIKSKIFDGATGVLLTGAGFIEECEIHDIKATNKDTQSTEPSLQGTGLDISGKATVVKCEIYDCDNGIQASGSEQIVFRENKLNRNKKNWDIKNTDFVKRINNVPNN